MSQDRFLCTSYSAGPKSFPTICVRGVKSGIHEMLTALFVGRNLFKVLQLSATDGMEGDGSEQKLTGRKGRWGKESEGLM